MVFPILNEFARKGANTDNNPSNSTATKNAEKNACIHVGPESKSNGKLSHDDVGDNKYQNNFLNFIANYLHILEFSHFVSTLTQRLHGKYPILSNTSICESLVWWWERGQWWLVSPYLDFAIEILQQWTKPAKTLTYFWGRNFISCIKLFTLSKIFIINAIQLDSTVEIINWIVIHSTISALQLFTFYFQRIPPIQT